MQKSEMEVKVSIIVPVYNDMDYLEMCLNSLVNQTLKEIEIICVNDASTDYSLKILESYARKDERIKIISYETNKSASQARKDGVLSSVGAYILFVDSDDLIELNTCEALVAEMDKKPVDILHFGSHILNSTYIEANRIASIERLVAPYIGELCDSEVFDACFLHNKYQFTLWNKMYSSKICKRAFFNIEDAFLPKAQDLYAFFLIAYYAKSYRGIEGKFYNYNYGCGITGRTDMYIDSFWRFCHQALIPQKISCFIVKENLGERYASICNDIEGRLLKECVYNWANRLVKEDQSKGYDCMVEFWGLEKTVSALEDIFYQKRDFVAEKIIMSEQNKVIKRNVKTIGVYYHRISNGGVQRVISKQIPMFMKMGYKIVLITDEEPCDNDYDMPKGVERVIISNCFCIKRGNYYERAQDISALIKTYNIDLIISHTFALNILFWDLCMIRGNGIPVILCTHSVFSFYLVNGNFEFFRQIPWVYRMSNKVISLSSVDKLYYDLWGLRTQYIPNPVEITVERERMTQFKSDNILWVGRISEEKKPLELIRAFDEVVRNIPTAKLYLVGDGPKEYVDIVKNEIEQLDLQDTVILCGFRKDVDKFYEQASIYVSTSLYEGFSMTNVESKLFGVPSIMFEMPYLELLKDKKGYIFVEQGMYQEMARKIIYLLRNKDELTHLGKEARESIEAFAKFDYIFAWTKVFADIYDEVEYSLDTDGGKMLNVLFEHWRIGNLKESAKLTKAKEENFRLRKENERQKKEIIALRESNSYKIGHKLMYLPGLIKNKIIKK